MIQRKSSCSSGLTLPLLDIFHRLWKPAQCHIQKEMLHQHGQFDLWQFIQPQPSLILVLYYHGTANWSCLLLHYLLDAVHTDLLGRQFQSYASSELIDGRFWHAVRQDTRELIKRVTNQVHVKLVNYTLEERENNSLISGHSHSRHWQWRPWWR